jgi:hypothetical protein
MDIALVDRRKSVRAQLEPNRTLLHFTFACWPQLQFATLTSMHWGFIKLCEAFAADGFEF